MWIKITLIILGITILILPIISKIKINKKLTKSGVIFLICAFVFGTLQIINEKRILHNEIELSNINDSLNQLLINTDRPLFHLMSAKLIKNDKFENKYAIDFDFVNSGKRAATKIFGKSYVINGDENPRVFDGGTFNISLSHVIPYKVVHKITRPLPFNPDLKDLDELHYFYFDLKYSDLILDKQYSYEEAVKMFPFKKGNYLHDLGFCKEWEKTKLKKIITKNRTLLNN